MAKNERPASNLDKIDDLIKEANRLKQMRQGSADYDLWKKRVDRLLQNIGDKHLLKQYQSCFPRVGFAGGDDSHYQKMYERQIDEIKNVLTVAKEELTTNPTSPPQISSSSTTPLSWPEFLSNCPTAYVASSVGMGKFSYNNEDAITPFDVFEIMVKKMGKPPRCSKAVKQCLQEAIYAYCFGLFRSAIINSVVAIELRLRERGMKEEKLYVQIDAAKKEGLLRAKNVAHALRCYENAAKHEDYVASEDEARTTVLKCIELIRELQN